MENIRRSGRELKQVQHFNFNEKNSQGSNNNEPMTDDEDAMDSQSVNDTPLPENKQNRKKLQEKQSSGGSIFELVNRSKQVDGEVDRWIAQYKSNKVAAMVDLVNFILQAAGSKRSWIARDVELEALDPSELDELLRDMMKVMSESENSKSYPLLEKSGKGSSTFRERFQHFFEVLAEKIQALPKDAQKKSLNTVDILQTLVDQLGALSSMALVNVRVAVTESALSIAAGILRNCAELKDQIAVAHRQISALQTGNKTNPKFVAVVKRKDEASKELDSLFQLTNGLVQSILVHRIKDFSEEVRIVCVRRLQAFLVFDPKAPLRVEYLKYVGFCCSDYSQAVRLEAVKVIITLLGDDKVVGLLQQFVEHFMNRFIQMAGLDADPAVSLHTVQALRLMQKHGLLDSLPESQLDQVDQIVFDADCSGRLRQEALAFLMDHTEGFEQPPADEEEGVSQGSEHKTKDAGKKKTITAAAESAKALAKRRRTALQLEALTEFAEHHLGDQFEVAQLLAEACLLLPHYDVLFDWSTIVSLLLRESDDLISSALRPSQIAILLRMFVTSALDVNRRRIVCQAQVVLSRDDQAVVSNWEALNVNLQRNLSALILRFKDDERNLAQLSHLLGCCDFSASSSAGNSSAAAQKNIRALLRVVSELFHAVSSTLVVTKMINALKMWQTAGNATVSGAVGSAANDIVRECWEQAKEKFEDLRSSASTRPSKSPAKSKSKSVVQESGSSLEHLRSLQALLNKCRLFWMQMDCRAAFEDEVEVGVLVSMCELTATLPHRAHTLFPDTQLAVVDFLCATCAEDAAWILQSLLLWKYRDVVDRGERLTAAAVAGSTAAKKRKSASHARAGSAKKARGAKEVSADSDVSDSEADGWKGGTSDEIEASVNSIVELRETLVAVLRDWMAQYSTASESGLAEDSVIKRKLALVAFRQISDLRSFFPVKTNRYEYLSQLAFTPSEEVLALFRAVYDAEGRTSKQLSEVVAAVDDGGDVAKISNRLVQLLLLPLSRSLLHDLDNLNKRQAAAVLNYLLEPSECVQEALRLVLKSLKDSDVVKYLEIQMVALRSLFAEQVAAQIRLRMSSEEDEDFDVMQHCQLEELGHARCDNLAKKLSQSLGVGKLRDEALRGLLLFMRAGIDFCLSERAHVGFGAVLAQYIRFLPAPNQEEVAQFFSDQVAARPEIGAELLQAEQQEEVADKEFVILADFQAQLRGNKKTSRRRGATVPASPAAHVVEHEKQRTPAGSKAVVRKNTAAPKQSQVRHGSRSRKAMSYAEQEGSSGSDGNMDVEEDEEEEEVRVASQRSVASAAVSRGSAAMSSRQQQNDFAYGLDIEDDEEVEDIEEEEEDVPASAPSRSQRSQLSLATTSASQRVYGSGRKVSSSVGPDELDSIPSTRRYR